jgi:hypothetical protein
VFAVEKESRFIGFDVVFERLGTFKAVIVVRNMGIHLRRRRRVENVTKCLDMR